MGTVGSLASCISNSEDELFPDAGETEVPVTFAPSVGAAGDTRAAQSSGESTGEMTTDKLKETGFGVFAFYSEDKTYEEYWKSEEPEDNQKDEPFNFMFNQQVRWNNTYWTYEPLKYWPNDNQPADNQGATGSVEHSYLSFFAYAPYTDNTVSEESGSTTSETQTEKGSIAVTRNTEATGTTYINYRMSDTYPGIFDKNVDLLWTMRPNLWKMMDETERNEDGSETVTHPGYVNGQVKFNFKHALSKFIIYVQGLFDRTSTSDNSTDYPDDVDPNTRILVESVDFSGSPLKKQGKMYLVPNSEKETNTLVTVPRWELAKEDEMKLIIKETAINADIRHEYDDMKDYFKKEVEGVTDPVDKTRQLFKVLPEGVTKDEKLLFSQTEAGEDAYYLVIPNKDYIENNNEAMKVNIVYYVITYDENLKLNEPQYCSIVKNEITATFTDGFVFEPNKQYKLRLLLGLTTVKFELEMAEGWDVPLVMDPVVIDWHIVRKEIDIDN